MRYLLLLIGGCIPLALLTAESLYGWLVLQAGVAAVQAPTHVEPTVAELEKDARRALEALSKAEISAAQGLSSDSLGPFSLAWSQWRMTREFVGRWLEAVALTSDDRQAAQALAALKERYAAAPPLGGRRLLEMLQNHLETKRIQSQQNARQAEAQATLAMARNAFAAGRFTQCAAQCDELLAKYADAFSPEDRQKLTVLRQRSRFRADSQQLDEELSRAADSDARIRLLKQYLGQHASGTESTPSEQATLEKYQRELRRLLTPY